MQAADPQAIRELAARMCRAPGPPGALVEAARACINTLSGLTYVGLAVMAGDRQTLRYNTLHSLQPGAAGLGAIATASAAAGIAIDMMEVVHVRDLDAGDLGMEDLQYLRLEHSAHSFIAVPLVMSQAALGALCLASGQAHAFTGQEAWLQVVAALCSPYLTLMKSHQEFLAVEGLVTQMMPVRVALQLRAAAAAQATQQQQQQSSAAAAGGTDGNSKQQHEIAGGLAGRDVVRAGDASNNDGSADFDIPPAAAGGASSSAAAMLQGRQQQLRGQAGGTSSSRSASSQQSSFHGRRRQQQQQGSDLLQTQQQRWQQRWVMGPFLTFKQPRLEAAYRTLMHRQWQQLLDGLFLLLVVLSAVGGRVSHGFTGDVLIDGSICIVLLVICIRLLHRLHDQPTPLYLRWRLPVIAAVRLLRVALFCIEAWHLPRHVFKRQAFGAAAGAGTVAVGAGWRLASGQVMNWSRAEVAGSGIVVMQGLIGQLPLLLHAVVQLVSVVAVVGVLWAATVTGQGASSTAAAVPLPAVCAQLLVGWLVPVAVVAFVEWHTRRSFLRKLR